MKKFESELVAQIPRLRRYARALTGNSHCADDLVQDTLERALNKHQLWHRGSRLRPWLFTIMHNLFINQVRRSSSQPPIQELDDNIRDHGDNPESQWSFQHLQASIGKLPDEQKQVFLLVSLEGFAYEEVAGIMDIPVGTVMSRLSRARDRLRQLLTEQQQTRLRRVK
jgi:RNA polymerase sigma-70 factor (ECF subfamily)